MPTKTTILSQTHDLTMTGTIGRSKSYYHTIMTMTDIIGRSKSYYYTIMTMTATIGIEVNLTIIQS